MTQKGEKLPSGPLKLELTRIPGYPVSLPAGKGDFWYPGTAARASQQTFLEQFKQHSICARRSQMGIPG
eukprot:3393938-Rhodomonas_salina.1